MSLFEITSLDSDYKLFDDDPFLLDPDDSCLPDDASDEADSLTGTLSPASQSQPSLPVKRQHVGNKHMDPAASPIIKQEVLTHDVYLEVHNYCTTASSIRSTASSPGLQESNNSIDVVSDELHEEDSYDMDDEEIDCDEDDDDLMKLSLKSNSSTSSPTSVGHRRKSMMDRSLSEEEKRLLLKEGYSNFPENGNLTKGEEKILRKIRRKIRNKKSAQCSRQRKKEYVEELEKKYSKCTNENLLLKKEVMKLKRENTNLATRIKNLIADGSAELSDQASFKTSFFVLCLSFLLILVPFMAPEAMEDMGMMVGKGEDGMMPGRHLLMASNFSPHDLYGESHNVASAINSTTDQLLSVSF